MNLIHHILYNYLIYKIILSTFNDNKFDISFKFSLISVSPSFPIKLSIYIMIY